MDYKPFLIKVGQSGAYSDTMTYEDAFDTKEKYGLWIQHSPYYIQPSVKNAVTQTWNDEDGDDVYLSPNGVKFEAYEFTVDFVYFEKDNLANTKIAEFVEKIKGKWLKVYDSYTQMCRTGVYFVSVEEATHFQRRGMHDTAIFTVTFKVNNPNFNDTF